MDNANIHSSAEPSSETVGQENNTQDLSADAVSNTTPSSPQTTSHSPKRHTTLTREIIIALAGIVVGATCTLLTLAPGSVGYNVGVSIGLLPVSSTPSITPTTTPTPTPTSTPTPTHTPTWTPTPTPDACDRLIKEGRDSTLNLARDCRSIMNAITPSNEDDFVRLGYMKLNYGVDDQAMEYFDEALQINPTSLTAWQGKCRAMISLYPNPRFETTQEVANEMFQTCTRAIVIAPEDPSNAIIYAIRGFINFKLQSCDASMSDYERAIELAPENASLVDEYLEIRGLLNNDWCLTGAPSG